MRKALVAKQDKERDRHGFRGVPSPPSFSLKDLPDDTQLTEREVAGYGRWSTNTVQSWRQDPDHALKWEVVAGRFIRYRAGNLRDYMAQAANRRIAKPPPRPRSERRQNRSGSQQAETSTPPSPSE
jgi:hypothetical protein